MIIFLSFISLGLPDAALGTAWPAMYPELGVSIGAAGMIALVVTAGTIVSSLMSGTVLGRFGTGKVNFASTLLTGLALLGYALTPSYVWILVFAVPLGLGAGSVDAGLNSYVAMHYKAHHMNWLHSFWGMGATLSPVILAQIISRTGNWRTGYQTIATIQLTLAGCCS
jgi:MFS family permease